MNNIQKNNNLLINNGIFKENYTHINQEELNPYKYHIAVFNSTKKLRDSYRILGANYFMTYSIDWVDPRIFASRLSILGINHIVIIRVLSNDLYSNLKSNMRITPLWSDEVKLYQNNDLNDIKNFPIIIKTLSINDLFQESFFTNEILTYKEKENWDRSYNYLFCFEDITLPELLIYFRKNNILYSQGSPKFRSHVLPIKFRLAQIIGAIEKGSQFGVNNSYHLPETYQNFGNFNLNLTKINLNWTKV